MKVNYRPNSFISIDGITKNKILANIKYHIKNRLHHDQMGIMPEMQAWFNIRNFPNGIYYIKGYKEKSNWIMKKPSTQFNTHFW